MWFLFGKLTQQKLATAEPWLLLPWNYYSTPSTLRTSVNCYTCETYVVAYCRQSSTISMFRRSVHPCNRECKIIFLFRKPSREFPNSRQRSGSTYICRYTPQVFLIILLGDSYDGNLLIGVNLNALWFYREHNRLARGLAKINPCWDDQKLFETARQINIAQWQHIFFYELIPNFIGEFNFL